MAFNEDANMDAAATVALRSRQNGQDVKPDMSMTVKALRFFRSREKLRRFTKRRRRVVLSAR